MYHPLSLSLSLSLACLLPSLTLPSLSQSTSTAKLAEKEGKLASKDGEDAAPAEVKDVAEKAETKPTEEPAEMKPPDVASQAAAMAELVMQSATGASSADAAGPSEDAEVAWEMLEVARVILQKAREKVSINQYSSTR